MDEARVDVNGTVYSIRQKYATFGEPYSAAETIWTLYTIPGNKSAGTLINLGKDFGYRLILMGDRGEQKPIDYTADKVTFL